MPHIEAELVDIAALKTTGQIGPDVVIDESCGAGEVARGCDDVVAAPLPDGIGFDFVNDLLSGPGRLKELQAIALGDIGDEGLHDFLDMEQEWLAHGIADDESDSDDRQPVHVSETAPPVAPPCGPDDDDGGARRGDDDVDRHDVGELAADVSEQVQLLEQWQLTQSCESFPKDIYHAPSNQRVARLYEMWHGETYKMSCKRHANCSLMVNRAWFPSSHHMLTVCYEWAASAMTQSEEAHYSQAWRIAAAHRPAAKAKAKAKGAASK